LVVVTALLAWLIFRTPSPKRLLKDGSLVAVTALKVGKTNIFRHGSWPDKMIGPHLSTNGLHILKMTVTQPQLVTERGWPWAAPLSIEFQVDGTKSIDGNQFLRPSFYRASRIVHWGDDGYKYFEDSPEFRKYRDGYFGYVTTSAFARRSKTIHIRIEERKTMDAPWASLAEFEVKNPYHAKEEDWPIEPFPIQKTKDNFLVELSNVKVYRPRKGLHPWGDIWEQRVDYLFRVFRDNQLVTNWIPHRVYVIDSTGNERFHGATENSENGFVFSSGFQTADPTTTWKIKAHFGPGSNFAQSNVFNYKLPFPSSPFPPRVGPIITDFQGLNVSFTFQLQDMLTVSMPTNAINSRLLALDVTNDEGKSVKNASGAMDQHTFWVHLNRDSITSNIFAKVAIVPDMELEFTFRPTLEK
jgi:hypothetical protein